jgi:hypothetical protein
MGMGVRLDVQIGSTDISVFVAGFVFHLYNLELEDCKWPTGPFPFVAFPYI